MKFVSTKRAYRRWQRVVTVEIVMIIVITVSLSLGDLWPTLIAGLSLAYLDGERRLYRTLFWLDALRLHASVTDGEPEIYQFMKHRHQREHARRVFEERMKKGSDYD